MIRTIKPVKGVKGTIDVPGDKSISHRALILGSICDGDVVISNLSTAADCYSSLSCLRDLGIVIDRTGPGSFKVHGRGRYGFHEPANVLDAGNSGTTIRLLAGLLAGQSFYTVLTGDDSLRERPMKRVVEPLQKRGAQIRARNGNTRPPLTIFGGELEDLDYVMPVASAQVKSALMISGLFCRGKTRVTEALPSRDHTERLLRYLDAHITSNNGSTTLEGGELSPHDIAVPGDISSAMFLVAAALLTGQSRITIANVGVNPSRLGCVRALISMGGEIRVFEAGTRSGEPYGIIEACSSGLHGIEIEPCMIPSLVDEVPLLALAATQAVGRTVISGAGELRFKESDRLKNTADELNRMGAQVTEKEDGLIIDGPTSLKGAEVDSHGDHRLAMTLAIAGMIAKGETVIKEAESVGISFPDFFEKIEAISL